MKLDRINWIVLLLPALLISGCGRAEFSSAKLVDASNEAAPQSWTAGNERGGEASKSIPGAQDPPGANQMNLAERKIIYTASVSLVVENFDGLEQQIRETVSTHGGYLAQANLDRMQGESRRGRWRARIPVARYDDFLKAVAELGVPSSQQQNAQDVTEEFVDLEARVANKRKLESRIIELLDRPDDKIQHVIEVERELARVREEIERMEGRIRFLSDQTAMTTVDISAREERNYQPPQALTLSNRVSTAWTRSLDNTGRFFQDAIVFMVGNAIPIIAWLAGIVVGLFILRMIWRRFRGTAPGY